MDPQDAIDLIRAAVASGKPISVRVTIEGAERRAGARSGAERMRAFRAKQRDADRHETSHPVTKVTELPPDLPGQIEVPDLGSESASSRKSAFLASDVRKGTRANGAERDEVTHVTVTSRKRRAPRIPTECPEHFDPPADFLEAQAERLRAPVERLRAEIPDFVYYWRRGDGAGKKKADWIGTFRRRLEMLAERGTLYVGPQNGARATRPTDIRQKSAPFDFSKVTANGKGGVY